MRRQLGVLILGFAGMLMGVVAFFSPYDPVVGPYVEIETLWAIEDARMESEGAACDGALQPWSPPGF